MNGGLARPSQVEIGRVMCKPWMDHRYAGGVVTLLACAFLTRHAASADWPTYQHDHRRTGFTSETIEASRLKLTWSWRSPSPPRPAWAGPAKWDAYAQNRNLPSMRSYDWVLHPIAVGDSIYFGSSIDDSLHCLSARTGRESWSYTTDGPIRVAPTYDKDRLYFGSDDGYAYCLRASDGALVWRFRPKVSDRLILNNGDFIPFYPCRTGVLIDKDIAYFAMALLPWKDAYLCAVDAQSGRQTEPGHFVKRLHGRTMEGPLAASARLLIMPQGRVAPQVFSRRDGKDLGQIKKSGGGSIVVVTLQGQVMHGPATDSRKGGISSSSTESMEMVAGYGRGNALAVAGHQSYMLTDDELIASDLRQRKVTWKVPCQFPHALVMASDVLFAGGTDAVAAFAAKDGQLLWRHAVDGKVFGMAVANGRLIVSTDSGQMACFRAAAPGQDLATGEAARHSQHTLRSNQPSDRIALSPIQPVDDKRLHGRWVFQQPHVDSQQVRALAGALNGQFIGKPRIVASGKHQSLAFDGGADSVLIANDHNVARLPTRAITVTAWVRVDLRLKWGGIVGAVQDNGDFERGWILGFRESKFCFALAGQNGNGRLTYLTGKSDFTKRRWYHVAGTYDGKTLNLYVNGRLENSSSEQQGDIHYPPRAFYEIGAYHDKDEYYRMTGRVHEVRVYRGAMRSSEIADHYRTQVTNFPATAPAPQPLVTGTGPWLQFTAPNEAVVRWRTDQPSPTLFEYRLRDDIERFEDRQPKTRHQVRLSHLKHNRTYHYRITTEIAGQSRTTQEFECDTFFDYSRPRIAASAGGTRRLGRAASISSRRTEVGTDETDTDESEPFSDVRSPSSRVAAHILAQTQVDRGICLVVGSGDGSLAYHLARQSQLGVIGVSTDVRQVSIARQKLKAAGVYGSRVTIHHVQHLDRLPFSGCFANLVVSQSMLQSGELPGTAAEVFRILRPDGGIAFLGRRQQSAGKIPTLAIDSWMGSTPVKLRTQTDDHGVWAQFDRGPLPGAGEWSHLYARADNSAFGGEQLGGVNSTGDLQVQWLGRPGPRYQADRSGRKPSPLSTAGRLFLQGLHRIVAVDAYNGTVLWAAGIPDLERFNVPRDCGNWCADRQHVYVAIRDKCWRLDAKDGKVSKFYDLVPSHNRDWIEDWGYLAQNADKLIGSAIKRGSVWTNFWGGASEGWYDARTGPVTAKLCSDNLFALDKQTGDVAWSYPPGLTQAKPQQSSLAIAADPKKPPSAGSGGVIVNSTVTIADDQVFFVESRNVTVKASLQRRVGVPELWQDQYLVALDANSGSFLWERPLDTQDGTVVFYMAQSEAKLIIVASTENQYHVYAFSSKNGDEHWYQRFDWPEGKGDHGKAMARPAIVNGVLYVRPRAFSLHDGTPLPLQMPVGKCGTYACSTQALFFREHSMTVWDRVSAKSTTWPRLRPDCWISTIPAGGMLLAPEGGGGCSCGSWMETSIGFLPLVYK